MTIWRYTLKTPFRVSSPHLEGIDFKNRWVTLHNGVMTVHPGYAWDGCTPAIPLVLGVWLGPWDGPRQLDGRPAAYRASLVHDVLCQFAADIPIRKDATLRLFEDLLRAHGFGPLMARVYTTAVRWFGPRRFGGDQ